MKEKIQKWLTDSTVTVDDSYGGARTVIIAEPDDILELAQELEPIVNQEVEKRIAERMPSEELIEEIQEKSLLEYEDAPICELDYYSGFEDGAKWLRSRLTCSGKPNNSQKTEGGEG